LYSSQEITDQTFWSKHTSLSSTKTRMEISIFVVRLFHVKDSIYMYKYVYSEDDVRDSGIPH
jgi:hypothetical protein